MTRKKIQTQYRYTNQQSPILSIMLKTLLLPLHAFILYITYQSRSCIENFFIIMRKLIELNNGTTTLTIDI